VGAPPDSEREAIAGFECLHRVAQSYLGPLWIASDAREGAGALRLLRRLALPEGTSAEKRREVAALGRRAIELEHPNVLRVLDVVEQGELLAFAYEQAEAEPLRSLQSWANLRGLSFPVGVALRIIIDLLEGVAALHALGQAAVLHVAGGLSPDSVLISRGGSTSLCDPVIASAAASIEAIGFNTAKLAYAAPEQVRPTARATTRADLFTCAAMLWELLASRRLLAGSRPAIERKLSEHNLPGLRASLRNPELVSDQLVALVEQALSADPEDRPASASDLAARLAACGHELAPADEVAAFVGKLSGPRFDRAAAAVRSRSQGGEAKPSPESREGRTLLGVPAVGHSPASDVDTPRGDPFEPSTIRGGIAAEADDDEGPTETAPLPPISFEIPPFQASPRPPAEPSAPAASAPIVPVAPRPKAAAVAPSPPSAPVTASASRWEAVPATRKTPPSGTSPLAPFGSRTIVGLGSPDHPALAPSVPFANLTPSPFAAPRPEPPASTEPEPSTDSAPTAEELSAAVERELVPLSEPEPSTRAPSAPSAAPERPRTTNPFDITLPPGSTIAADTDGPLPFQHLVPRSKRTSRPPSGDPPGSQNWFELHAPANAARGALSRHKLGLGLALAALLGLGTWLAVGARGSASSQATATASSERPAASDAPSAAPERSGATAEPPAAPAPMADAGARPSAAPAADKPAAEVAGARAADFAAVKLDDSQLVVLFALEGRKQLPSCAERASGKRSASDARRVRQQLDGAEQKLAAGDAAAAYELACEAATQQPSNVAAQRLLAELALELGDPARAKAAVDKALARTPKDKALIALRGDVLAMMGDMPASRAAWLRAAPPRGTKAARTKKLIAASKKLGDKALAASSYGQAAAFYRRAVVLSRGAYTQSFGLSEALLGLGRTQAALLWAERAAQALPKDSRWQVLFGDALYDTGQTDRARGAWKAALDAQPSNRTAARRVREGKPE
jgi:tetratricopeptide (TPR) repeat protein